MCEQTEDSADADRLYDLVSVVVHCGTAIHRGHYVTLGRCAVPPNPAHSMWLIYDDDIVEVKPPPLLFLLYMFFLFLCKQLLFSLNHQFAVSLLRFDLKTTFHFL